MLDLSHQQDEQERIEDASLGSPSTSPITTEMKLTFRWDLSGLRGDIAIISGMRNPLPGKEWLGTPFRAGLRNRQTTQLFFMSTGLDKVGLKILAVACSHPGPGGIEALMQSVPQENRLVQLFKRPFPIHLTDPTCFTFNVYLTGTAPNYHSRLGDSYQIQQLWRSAKLRHFTDLEFVVQRCLFSAHKVVVAARSPVFAAMLSSGMTEARTNRIVINDMLPAIFKHFLRFMYTGEFDIGPCVSEGTRESLYRVADKYQVETLKQLCQAPVHSISPEELTASLFDSRSTGLLPLPTPEAAEAEEKMDCDGPGTVLVFTWRLDRPGPDGKAVSNFFQYQNEDVFRAGIARKLGPHPPQQYMLYLAATNFNKFAISINTVAYFLSYTYEGDPSTYSGKRIFMTDEGDHAVRRFAAQLDVVYRVPCYITFFVEIGEEETTYEHNIGDVLLPEQMWLAVQSRVFTDVTFRVGNQEFAAHRFVLSARSPVFEAMFRIEENEVESNDPIIVEDMEPINFEHMLHFLYTGQLRTSASNSQLKAAAEKYQLTTLKGICTAAESAMDEDEVTTSLLKYWVQTA